METLYKPAVFTSERRRVTINWFVITQRYLFYQRCVLQSRKKINAGILTLILGNYFPGLRFIPEGRAGQIEDLAITNYIIQKNGKWGLDLAAMAKSREKNFSSLFPGRPVPWNEAKAISTYGCPDVIRFFIDGENEKFLAEFNKLKKSAMVKISGKKVLDDFFKNINRQDKCVWEDWDFSSFVLHRMRHNPSSVYEAFGYYGHRRYTLYSYGLNAPLKGPPPPEACMETRLLETGTAFLNDAIENNFPAVKNFDPEHGVVFFELVQETLESVPSGTSMYAPTGPDVFMRQLGNKMPSLYRKLRNGDADTYTAGERKNIKNHLKKMQDRVDDAESVAELRRVEMSGTYQEKINLLHRLLSVPSVRALYPQREIDIIHGLFLKQFRSGSLDMELNNSGDEEGSFTAYDYIGDEKYPGPDDRLVWTSFFKTEFEPEFNDNKLKVFLECLPDHFSRYPFAADGEGNLQMSKYSKKILFATFCSIVGIDAGDEEIWKLFLILIKKTLDNINNSGRVRRN
jgi:hypothetical protein